MFIFGLCSQVFIYGGIGFLSPTFTLHMTSNYEGFDEFWIGIYFAMPAVAYIINTPFVPTYCAKFGRRVVLLTGSTLFCFSILMIGTSPTLGFPDHHKTVFIGTLILGFSACMVTVPIMPEMLHRIELQMPEIKGEELNNVASGYYNSFLGIGETIGPVSASILVEQLGFRTAFDCLGCLIALYCITYGIYINESEMAMSFKNLVNQTLYDATAAPKAKLDSSAINNETTDEIIQHSDSAVTHRNQKATEMQAALPETGNKKETLKKK